MKTLHLVGLVVVLAVIAVGARIVMNYARQPQPSISQEEIFSGVSYAPIQGEGLNVSVLADSLVSPTRVKITPDGAFLVVTQITGEVVAFARSAEGWDSKPQPVLTIDTRFPGFPPDEGGLVGIVFSSTYATTGKTFFLYTYKDKDGTVQNRISTAALTVKGGRLAGSTPELIFEANSAGAASHQITDGVSVEVAGKPHLLVLIGEGFQGKRAQDPALEAGKVLLMQENGSNPLGTRPYPENPKVQALGIRNAYVISRNSFDPLGRILIADTGPEKFDRILFTKLFEPDGTMTQPLNFGWDGTEESLEKSLPDSAAGVNDVTILRLSETLTFTGLAVYSGKSGVFPESDVTRQTVLATVFGKTGSSRNTPGKEVWLGTLDVSQAQPKISFEPLLRRVPAAEGKLGHPIGLEVDPQTGDFFFADILEGRVYWAQVP